MHATRHVCAAAGIALLLAAPGPADAKTYKNCYMDKRFRPPARVCDDPNPPKKRKPVKDRVLEPIRSKGPSPFSSR